MYWGIQPTALIGHSLGEYTAACLSGVFSLEDALKLVVKRAKLMQQTSPGAMLGVPGIYCGSRKMLANAFMKETGMLLECDPDDLVDLIWKILEGKLIFPDQSDFRKDLLNKWDDVTELVLDQIN